MELNVFYRAGNKSCKGYTPYFEKIFQRTIEVLKLGDDVSVSVIFVRDGKMHEINRDYRNVDRTTDVISFALRDNQQEGDYVESELGDIFINIDAAERQAVEYQHSLRREVCFLFTHGLLHLNGYDHMKPEDEKVMIAMQKKILDPLIDQNDETDHQ